jgi:signal transduction histidine kinase
MAFVASVVALVCLGFIGVEVSRSQEQTATPVASGELSEHTPVPSPTPTPIQPTNLHQWGAVTLFHGLPSNRVRAIAEGKDGTMWFGTDAGLARYDGRRTQAVTAQDLPSGRILALKYDEADVLWIGTETGAARLVGNIFLPVPEANGKAVTAILNPVKGRAILATADGLLLDCQTVSSGELVVAQLPAEPLRSAEGDKAAPLYLTSMAMSGERLLVGTRSRGIIAIEQGKARELDLKPRAYFVEALTVDSMGTVIVGAKTRNDAKGLFRVGDHLQASQLEAPTGAVTAVANGPDGNLWVGTDGRGAFRLDNERIGRFTFDGTAGGLRSDHIYSIFIDREEIVWFGTDRGVCRYDPHAPRSETISSNPESNFIRVLYRTKSGAILAGTNRGLFAPAEPGKDWQRIESLGRNAVYAISEDANGRLLVGAAGGMYVGDRQSSSIETLRFTNISPRVGGVDGQGSVRAIAQFRGSSYIASFGRGVERVQGTTLARVWPTDGSDQQLRETVSLFSDESTLWIGTASRGVFIFDGKTTKQDPLLGSLRDTAVWSILADRDKRVWFATAAGLFSLKNAQLTPVITGVDARDLVLSEEYSTDRAQPLRSVWCATSGGGLIKAMFDERLGVVVSRLDAEQGLPSQNAFAVLPIKNSTGGATVLVGTNRGLARFEPASASPRLEPVQAIGKRLYTPSELYSGLNLEYPQNSIVFNIVATSSRTFPEQFQYAFQLFDESGKLVRQKFSHDPQFALEGLKPGRFRVEAVAFSKDLVPSLPLVFRMTVAKAPFPWTSTALAILLSLALMALWWGYLQNRRIRRTGKELLDANRQLATARMDLANEAETERRRIARDLHDQTLADLRNLLMLTDRLPVNGHADADGTLAPTAFRGEIESISTEIRRICEDLSPSALENVGLAAALEWALLNAVTHAPPERKFEYRIECQDDLEEQAEFKSGMRMQIYRIAQEVINNICRHSGATLVTLTTKVDETGMFELRIENDGREFSPAGRKKGRGLTNIQSRATMIEAMVKWEKREGGGMVFILQRPSAPLPIA